MLSALDRIRTLYNARDPELLKTLAIIRLLEKQNEDRNDLLRKAQSRDYQERKKRGKDDLPMAA